MNVHPTVIAKGYRMASEKSQEILNNLATEITEKNVDILRKIAITAMTGKGAESYKEQLAELAGTNKSYISKLERNLKDIRFSTLQRIINEGLGGHLDISIRF
jgi:chaperonin GroEL (HSP60 family)